MLEKFTLQQQVWFYLNWCKDNGKKPQDFESLNEYLTEICENA